MESRKDIWEIFDVGRITELVRLEVIRELKAAPATKQYVAFTAGPSVSGWISLRSDEEVAAGLPSIRMMLSLPIGPEAQNNMTPFEKVLCKHNFKLSKGEQQ